MTALTMALGACRRRRDAAQASSAALSAAWAQRRDELQAAQAALAAAPPEGGTP